MLFSQLRSWQCLFDRVRSNHTEHIGSITCVGFMFDALLSPDTGMSHPMDAIGMLMLTCRRSGVFCSSYSQA